MNNKRINYWLRPRGWNPAREMKRYRTMSMKERGRHITELGELTSAILENRKERKKMLSYEEPRPEAAERWWRELVLEGRKLLIDKPG